VITLREDEKRKNHPREKPASNGRDTTWGPSGTTETDCRITLSAGAKKNSINENRWNPLNASNGEIS